jgi:hypothetical protein
MKSMGLAVWFAGVICWSVAGAASAQDSGRQTGDLAVREVIAAQKGDARLDHAAVDPVLRQLYVARGFGVTAVDLDSGKTTRQLVPGQHVHAVVPLPGGKVLSTNGDADTATLFEGKSGKVIAELVTGKEPDAAVYDPASDQVLVINAKDGTATVIDPVRARAVDTVRIGGNLEFAVADGSGHVFVNIEDEGSVAVIDTRSKTVVSHYDLPGCDRPTGLGLDPGAGILLAACANRIAVALHAADGTSAGAPIAIDRRPDAVIFDPVHRRFLIPCGQDGTLIVIAESADRGVVAVASIKTAVGAHTGAIDPKTGLIYLPTADYKVTKLGFSPVNDSFRILVVGARP